MRNTTAPPTTGAIGASVRLGSFDMAIAIAVFAFLTLKLLPLVKRDSDAGGSRPGENSCRPDGPGNNRLDLGNLRIGGENEW